MKEVTDLLITKYCIKKLKHDFMGYKLQSGDVYTFHHLIVPTSVGGEVTEENGAILCGRSSHPYIHVIERYDHFLFKLITREIIKMKQKGYIDEPNLEAIDEMLTDFEDRFDGEKNKKGNLIILPEYKKRIQKNNC